MKLILEFDVDADLLDVPEIVIEKRASLRTKFLKWLYNPKIKHKYWIKITEPSGRKYTGLQYRSDAFVEWLNKNILKSSDKKATILEEGIVDYPEGIPVLFF